MLHASSARQQRSAASSRRDIGYRPKLGDKTSTNKARDTIEQLVGLTTIPLLQARFADIIWLLCKNYKMAEQAATNYLAAFKAVDDAGHWAYEFDRLKRGTALARMLGTNEPLFAEYVSFIETRLASLEPTGSDSFGTGLLELWYKYRIGDPSVAARIAECLGDRLEIAGNSSLAQTYFDIASRFYRAQSNAPDARRVGIKRQTH